MLQEAAAITTQINGEMIPSDVPGSVSLAVRQAAGVVLGIAPWNAPVILGVRAVATPLACGNTVVLKGSELCPATHGLIIDAFEEAGFPPGVVNFVTNAPDDAGEVVEAMVAHPMLRRVNFTGSTRVGKLIALTCAKYLKPAVLELGGKAPLIVLDDADLEAAVNGTAFGAFANSGQICMSTERIIVDRKIADAFVAKLAAKAVGLPLGDPRHGPVVLGSVIDQSTVQRCNALIDDALAKGAKLVCGGKADSTLMPATLLDHVTADMKIYHEESFGPVKPIVRVSRRRRGGARGQRQRLRPLGSGLRARHRACLAGGAAHRIRHLSRQRPHGARRGADALRRRQGRRATGASAARPASTPSPTCAGSRSRPRDRHYPF